MPPFTSPTFETARARVEGGDFSFDAIGALTIAHGELLVATDHLDRSAAGAARRTIKATVADDLIRKVRKAEGWTKREGGQLADIRRMHELYDVSVTRDGQYIAVRKASAQ